MCFALFYGVECKPNAGVCFCLPATFFCSDSHRVTFRRALRPKYARRLTRELRAAEVRIASCCTLGKCVCLEMSALQAILRAPEIKLGVHTAPGAEE